MKIIDKIYGEEDIGEPVLLELIGSALVQRLKGISQMGLPAELYHESVFSRYEHSVGVLVLLRRLGASLEEQVAGLLHDVSHSAFSHVIDWVIGDPSKEDHQDNIHEEILSDKDIVEILSRYGLDYKDIARIEDFTLLETELPSVCVDRFDYAMREIYKEISGEETKFILNSIKNVNGRMIFSNFRAAELFSFGYLKCQTEHWAGKEARARYYILADILRRALSSKIISIDDFRKTDNEVVETLSRSGDGQILKYLALLRQRLVVKESNEGIELIKKLRYVDPPVIFEGRERKLSEVSENYSKKLDNMLKESSKVKRVLVEGYNT